MANLGQEYVELQVDVPVSVCPTDVEKNTDKVLV